MINIFKKYKVYWILGLVAILVVAYFAFGKGNGTGVGYAVKTEDVVQSVTLSGKVQTSDRADLGFASSGRIGKIFVKNNQPVKQGAVLAQLEISDLLADLKIKELNSTTSDVNLKAAKENLDRVISQQNSKVESAYRTLLTDDLALVPNAGDDDLDIPVVSGIYDGAEGRYKITIDNDGPTANEYFVDVFDLERKNQLISEESPTPLGTRGLYILLQDKELIDYVDTTWYLDIPNKSSSSYLANYNAYNEAKNSRDLAIKEAESKYKALLSEEGSGGDSVAQAEVQKIRAEISKNTIYAPFDGKVTNIEKQIGENASTGDRIISILGEEKLEVVLQVSELDVSRLTVGSAIDISLDAFPGEVLKGTLTTVNSRETTVEGVPVYEAFVELESDPRIKTGMSVNGTIVIDSKSAVVAIPSYLITKDETGSSVEIMTSDGKGEKRQITTGLVGTDSMTEVLSGLSEGDVVLDTRELK